MHDVRRDHWKPCECDTHPNDVALVQNVFYGKPEKWQTAFTAINQGKFACFACGGEVQAENIPEFYDCVTGNAITSRLRQLGVI